MNRAVKEVESGKSVAEVARKFSLPRTTLQDHAKGAYHGYDTTFGPRRSMDEENEQALVNYLKYMAERGFPLTRKMLKILAGEIIKASGRKTSMNVEKGPSDKWVKSFLKRHSELSLRTPHLLDYGRAGVSQDQLDLYFELLKTGLEKISVDPTRIFNVDETGFGGKVCGSGEKVISKKGVRQAFQVDIKVSGHITANMAISASGQTLPPLIIFSRNLPRDSYADGLPSQWKFSSTHSGFINSELFFLWFVECFLPHIGSRRPCLLILDNHSTHVSTKVIDEARRSGVDLLFLPAKTSHILQPLDVGYFHVLKSKVAEITSSLGYAGASHLPRHVFPKVIHQAMNRIQPATVTAAFSATGIYPFDSTKVKVLESHPTQHNEYNERQELPEPPRCPVCKQNVPSTNSMLVKIGMVPEALKEILVPPPSIQPRKKSDLTEARLHPSSIPELQESLEVLEVESQLPRHAPNHSINDKPLTSGSSKGKQRQKKFIPPAQRSHGKPSNPSQALVSTSHKLPGKALQDLQPGPSKIPRMEEEESDEEPDEHSELDTLLDEDMCCVCKRWSPPQLRQSPFIKVVSWAQCSSCPHWVHLKFCCRQVSVRRNEDFLCIHCLPPPSEE